MPEPARESRSSRDDTHTRPAAASSAPSRRARPESRPESEAAHPPSTDPAIPIATDITADERRTVDAIIAMYRKGWFPMADPSTDRVDWFRPKSRGIIPLEPDRFIVSRSLRQRIRSGRFTIRSNTAFREVITACAGPRVREDSTWINAQIIDAYCLLHRAGFAHSVEAWLMDPATGSERLVGGLYGVHLGSAFCGESMFSRPELGGTDASKVCLVRLVEHLRRRGFTLLDAQLQNAHLARFGCREIPHESYMKLLRDAASREVPWQAWE